MPKQLCFSKKDKKSQYHKVHINLQKVDIIRISYYYSSTELLAGAICANVMQFLALILENSHCETLSAISNLIFLSLEK